MCSTLIRPAFAKSRATNPSIMFDGASDVGSCFGLRDRGAGQQIKSGIVEHSPSSINSAMTVIGVFAQTVVGDDTEFPSPRA